MSSHELAGLVAACALASVHVAAGALRSVPGWPRPELLSAFGGVSVAYVAVHLLPEVAEADAVLAGSGSPSTLAALDRRAFLLLLAGIVTYYGVEAISRAARRSGEDRTGGEADGDPTPRGVFALSISFYVLYNALVGYLLPVRAVEGSYAELALFALALALHFVVNDVGLREHHRRRYHELGRWLLAGAVLLGWAVRAVWDVPLGARAAMAAFLAGGIVLNVFKEELPDASLRRFAPFTAGALAYSALLLVVE